MPRQVEVEGALAGISSSYTIKDKVQGNFSVLYNFLYHFEQAVYTSPWVFRFGVGLGLGWGCRGGKLSSLQKIKFGLYGCSDYVTRSFYL